MALSKKHRAFIDEYFLANYNGTEAYMRVYQPKSRDTARVNAARLLANANIQEELELRFKERQMGADEAIDVITYQARGDMGDYYNENSVVDLQDVRNRHLTRNIKKLKQKRTIIQGRGEEGETREIIETEIELYDAQAAADKILRVHGKYKNNEVDNNLTIVVRREDAHA